MKRMSAVAMVTVLALGGRAEQWIDQPETFWKDPSFQRAFMGSYGMRSDIEPRVTVVEKELMDKVMRLMAEEGGLAKAAELLEKSIKPSASAVFEFTLANVCFQEDRLTNAIAFYQAAIAKFPDFQRAHKNVALIHIRQGAFGAALGPLTKSIELGANDGMTYGLLGHAYAMTEQYVSSESAYRLAMMFQPAMLDWKLGLCRALFKQQKYGEVVALCDELLLHDPSRADYLLLQANAFLGMKQPMRAAEIYELLDLSGKTPVAALHTLGDIYVNEGQLEQASDAYMRAFVRDERPELNRQIRNAEVLASRAATAGADRLLKALDARSGAAMSGEQRKRMLKLEARLAAARNEAGDEQVRILEEIVKLDPLDGDALILLGQYHAPSNAEKAVFYFERAEGVEAFEADARLRHAQLLVKGGRYQEALPLLKRALELKPREDVQRYAEQVERAARRNS